MKPFAKLRGRIVEIFGTQKKFAEAIRCTEATVINKLSGKYDFSIQDIVEWAVALKIEKDEIGAYFFADRL